MLLKKTEKLSTNINPLLNDEMFLHFLKCGRIAVIYLDNAGFIQYTTPMMNLILGIENKKRGEYIGNIDFFNKDILYMNKICEFLTFIKNVDRSNNTKKVKALKKYQIDFELVGKNKITYQVIMSACLSDKNVISGIILNFHDISKRKLAEKALEKEKEKYKIIAELTECALWEYDIVKKELRQYRKLKGRYAEKNLIIKNYRTAMLEKSWVHPEDISIFNSYCDSMDKGEDYFQYELRTMGDNGEYIWVNYQGTGLKDFDGKVRLIMGRTQNIDREYKDHEKLVQKTQRDALTGLYNRAATKEKAEKYFDRFNVDNTFNYEIHSFYIIDIDNFKQVNDQWGHLYGDMLLETFAKHLENIFESTDVVGRIGGDEFVVLQKGIREENQIEETAQTICDIAKNFKKNIKNDNVITVSVGVAIYPKDGKNYDILYNKADIALYRAKSQGKNQYACYTQELEKEQRKIEYNNPHWSKTNAIEQASPDIEKRLINYAFDIVKESTDFDHAIQHIIQEIGKFYGLSRITIFECTFRNSQSHVRYEWCSQGVETFQYTPVKVENPIMQEYIKLFRSKDVYCFNNIKEIDHNPLVQKFFIKYKTKALIQFAFYDANELVGTISFEDCIAPREWTKCEFDTLYTLTKLISTYIIQLKNKQELDDELFFSQETLSNQKLSNYAIKEGTYELIYFSEYTQKQFPTIALGELCYKALYGKDGPCEPCPLKGLDENKKRYSIEAYNSELSSWYSTTATAVTLPNDGNINLICSSNVTGFIERVNSKDYLTGLITLSKFEAEGMKLLAEANDTKYYISYNDFDKFQNINDEWGYSVGNEMLIQYASLISKMMKSNELFCRVTADKFVMMVSYKDREEAVERIKECYHSLAKDLKITFPNVNAVMITGIYFLTPKDKILSVAMDRANLARKTIKGNHKSSFAIYDTSLHERVTKEKMIENHMHKALKNNEFIVYMQPKIDVATSEIIGAEALVRWKFSDGQILSPMEFIPVFERNGFINELDFYVYESTLQAQRKWMDMGKRELIVSLNVSRVHLNDFFFLERLDRLLKKYNIPTNLIELEITESMFFNELDRLVFFVKNLREHGFLISIDDFGAGYSSLNLLKTLPIDIVKLDREFFMSNEMRDQDKIVISGIVSLAKALGLKVISEGVETLEQFYFLKESLCDMAQGYLFYKPMPMEEFIELLN